MKATDLEKKHKTAVAVLAVVLVVQSSFAISAYSRYTDPATIQHLINVENYGKAEKLILHFKPRKKNLISDSINLKKDEMIVRYNADYDCFNSAIKGLNRLCLIADELSLYSTEEDCSEAIAELAEDELHNLYKDYVYERTDYEKAVTRLEECRKIISSDMDDLAEQIQSDIDDHKRLDELEAMYGRSGEDYAEMINLYESISEDDTKYYLGKKQRQDELMNEFVNKYDSIESEEGYRQFDEFLSKCTVSEYIYECKDKKEHTKTLIDIHKRLDELEAKSDRSGADYAEMINLYESVSSDDTEYYLGRQLRQDELMYEFMEKYESPKSEQEYKQFDAFISECTVSEYVSECKEIKDQAKASYEKYKSEAAWKKKEEERQELISLINDYRTSHGQGKLTEDKNLTAVCSDVANNTTPRSSNDEFKREYKAYIDDAFNEYFWSLPEGRHSSNWWDGGNGYTTDDASIWYYGVNKSFLLDNSDYSFSHIGIAIKSYNGSYRWVVALS